MAGKQATKTINLALQGGGAHGAFAWGVLDRLLDEERLAFEGVTATSAGAMNAVVLAHGLTQGGRSGAKAALTSFWREVSRLSLSSLMPRSPFDAAIEAAGGRPPMELLFDMATRLFSPYQLNPFNINPLRDLLTKSVDFDAIKNDCALRVFLSATNVRSGKIKIFENGELSPEAVMASGCLPFLFQAVELDGEAFWDGGYMGNPAIYPLIYHCRSRDVVIVHINPLQRDELPKDAPAILDRVNEISFNSSLMREMRAIAFVSDLVDKGQLSGRKMKRMLIHAVEADEALAKLSLGSKLKPDWHFLQDLRAKGAAAADAWLATNWTRLGRTSSIDIHECYL